MEARLEKLRATMASERERRENNPAGAIWGSARSDIPNGQKYVQHVLVEQPSLVQFLAAGAAGHVYVCGDANMATDVQGAMASVTGRADIVEALRREDRYHEDVLGAPLSRHSQMAAL